MHASDRRLAAASLAVALAAAALPAAARGAEDEGRRAAASAVVRVDVTTQPWAWDEPWRKRAPSTRAGYGVSLGQGRILTTARLVDGATLVELRRRAERRRWRARVVLADPLANLALLEPEDRAFLDGVGELPLGDDPAAPAEQAPVRAWRWDANDRPQAVPGNVVEVEGADAGAGDAAFLTFVVRTQSEVTGQGEPVVADGKLTGLGLAASGLRLQAVAPSAIRGWLADAARGPARRGLAATGWSFHALGNPELRAYLRVPAGRSGVLLVGVAPWASGAGVLRAGDVLLRLAGQEIDSDGRYEHPVYGRMPLELLLNDGRLAGDELDAEILRDGRLATVRIRTARDAPGDRAFPRVEPSGQPRYVVYAGLVFQELSKPYLDAAGAGALEVLLRRRLGGDGGARAGGRFVVLTKVLADPATMGYEGVSNELVARVNGREVHGLDDVVEALGRPEGAFQVVEFTPARRLVLDAAEAKAAQPRILEAYRIQPDRNLRPGW